MILVKRSLYLLLLIFTLSVGNANLNGLYSGEAIHEDHLLNNSNTSYISNKPGPAQEVYERRLALVKQTPGLSAFWDFVKREDGPQGSGKFIAHTSPGDTSRYMLEPHNISLDFWKDGDVATMDDFPLLGRGPFGQGVLFRRPRTQNDLPVLMVSREMMHDSPLDVKGPGSSVSMVVWLIHQEGSHAIAGLWHEGTDTPPTGIQAEVLERGRRQYGMFAGMVANSGASSAHISENGLPSFGDIYARHLAVTPEKMKRIPLDASDDILDAGWSVVGFVFDNENNTLTAYLDGVATDWWIDNPADNRFFHPNANAWRQTKLAKIPGLQPGEDPDYPVDQYYSPPEDSPLQEEFISESTDERVVLRTYEFTKVGTVQRRDENGQFIDTDTFDLVSLKVNPYYFNHDIYEPTTLEEGGPFTIGRVIHSNRHPTLTAYFGGVAVYNHALSADQMNILAQIGRSDPYVIELADINSNAPK
ncbi:MAG: hypothetical protein WD098_08925 [Balneolales bacterium]